MKTIKDEDNFRKGLNLVLGKDISFIWVGYKDEGNKTISFAKKKEAVISDIITLVKLLA